MGVRVIFKSGNTLRESLMRVKNPRPAELKKGSVYEVPCGSCNKVYIGETGRSLKERLKEHKYAVKTGNMRNGIAAHARKTQHPVDWTSARITASEQNLKKRKVLEAIHIREQPNNTNLDCGLVLNPIWRPLLPPPLPV